jgi:hypothetical protein
MQLYEIYAWHIYLCERCNLSEPPKDKWVVTVCKRKDSIWGFFINSDIPRFIQASPALAKSQVKVSPGDYDFLKYESFVGCNDLKSFFASELKQPKKRPLKTTTKDLILEAVKESVTIDPERIKILLDNKDND